MNSIREYLFVTLTDSYIPLPTVFIKFNHDDDKDNVYKAKNVEETEKRDKWAKPSYKWAAANCWCWTGKEADKRGFTTATNNKVSVLEPKANNTVGYYRINYTSDVANVQKAIKSKNSSSIR